MKFRLMVVLSTMVLLAHAGLAQAVVPIDLAKAQTIVAANVDLTPNDDIEPEHHARDIKLVDLDADGVPEIIYVATSVCIGANFDCPDRITVLTAQDTRNLPYLREGPYSSEREKESLATLRAGGYAVQSLSDVPGEILEMERLAPEIGVTFQVTVPSQYCGDEDAGRVDSPCPKPGLHHWQFRWENDGLQRIRPDEDLT